MQHQIHPNTIRQTFFLAVLIFLGIVIVRELQFLLLPTLGAITLYVLLRKFMVTLVVKYKFKKWLAAALLLLLSLVLIVGPFVWLVHFAVVKITPFIQKQDLLNQEFDAISVYLQNKIGFDIKSSGYLEKASGLLLTGGKQVLGGTLNSISILAMVYFILYFLLYQAFDVEVGLRKYLPFKKANVNKLVTKSRNLIQSNALGIPIVAIAQGIVGLIGYWIFGAKEFVLLGVLTAVASVIPIVGTMLIYIPLMLFMLAQGQTGQGVGIGIWGLVIIGGVDNIVRFLVAKKMANVHPLVTIFGVIMGVNLFGFLGIIFGPILLSLFVLLIEIYINEYGIVNADNVQHEFDT